MLPIDIKAIITRLDPGDFTSLLGTLLSAERARLGMAANSLVLSDAITVSDGGLDALMTAVPADGPAPVNLRSGLVGFQAKATKKSGPSAFGLDAELKKPGPVRVLRESGTYVLACCQDLNPRQRIELENAVLAAARKVARSRRIKTGFVTEVWDAQTLVELCKQHAGAVADLGLSDFTGAYSLEEMLDGELKASERPFRYDKNREEIVAHLRERALTSEDALIAVVQGFPGVGNTRTVVEALDIDELRDGVLYVSSTDGLNPMLIHMRRHRESGGILVVDEVGLSEGLKAATALEGLHGRWRAIVVDGRTDTRHTPETETSQILRPLGRDAMRELVAGRAMLQPPVADLVARAADGYPKLGFLLADALRDDPALGLAELARSQRPDDILKRAIPEPEARRHLGPIAMFQVVGFDDDSADQVDAVATTFGLDPAMLRHVCERELEAGRFVSARGRFRSVSPLIVAVWLAFETIENTPGLAGKIASLPESLQDSFLAQVEHFGRKVPALAAVLTDMLGRPHLREASSFGSLEAHLLRAGAGVVPERVAEALRSLLSGATNEDFQHLPLRELGWTCQILLWSPESWPTAVDALLLLARNGRGGRDDTSARDFTGCFSVLLSGSTVPYAERAAWLETRIDQAAVEDLPLLGQAAAAGIGQNAFRNVVGFVGGGEPEDWRPAPNEQGAATAIAWRLVLKVLDRVASEERPDIIRNLAENLRLAYRLSLSSTVDSALRDREWTTEERALLAAGLGDVLRYENWMPDNLKTGIAELRDWMRDDAGTGRLGVVVATPIWELHDDESTLQEDPQALVSLADDLATDEDGLQRLIASATPPHDVQTRCRLAALVAERLGSERVGEAAIAAEDWETAGGALSVADGRGEGDWATRVLGKLAQEKPDCAVLLVDYPELRDDRLEPILEAVEVGRTSGAGLWRLRFGGRIRRLSEEVALRLVRAVASTGQFEVALGMLDFWLEAEGGLPDAWLDFAVDLAIDVVRGPDSPMTDLYMQRLMGAKVLNGSRAVAIWEARMSSRHGSGGEVDSTLTAEGLRVAPAEIRTRIFGIIRQEAVDDSLVNRYATRRLALLSSLASATSPEEVWCEISGWSDDELRCAVHHMNWTTEEPEELVRLVLVSDRFAMLEGDATSGFTDFTGNAVGTISHVYAEQRDRAIRWRDLVPDTDADLWADDLATGYGMSLDDLRRREQEFPF